MAASHRSGNSSAGSTSSRRFQLASLIFLILISIPTIAIFCHNWNAASPAESPGAVSSPEIATLSSKEDHDAPGSWIAGFIKTTASAGQTEFAIHNPDNPFRTSASREMIMAKGDPFLAALAQGVSEGVLVVKGRSDGVLTLGPLLPKNTRAHFSDLETLRAIQSGVGGSFKNFYSNLFGNTQRDSALAAMSQHEENPFSKVMESLAEKHDTPADVRSETAQANKEQTTQHASKENATPTPVAIGSSSGPRPHLLLSVGDDGSLHAVPISQPSPGIFQASEIGVMNLPLLRFADTADFSGSISVADFNGDGYPDVAYYVPLQGLVRFFYGGSDGGFTEGLRVDIGHAERVLAAGDFNRDGQMDLAFSTVGLGIITVLFKDSQIYRFKSFNIDEYRDYILAADTTGSGNLDLLGLDFTNNGTVLIDFSQPDGTISGRKFDYQPSLNTTLSTSQGWSGRLNAVVLGSSLSLNVDNRQNQLMHVLNVLAGTKIYVIVGDLYNDGRLVLGFAIPHP